MSTEDPEDVVGAAGQQLAAGDETGPDNARPSSQARDGQDEILKSALAQGLTYQAAAAVAGISRRTVARRMSDAEFARDVAQLRREYVSVTTGRLMAMGPEAIDTLQECLRDGKPGDRRQAARDVLRYGLDYQRHTDVEVELAELRSRLEVITGEGER